MSQDDRIEIADGLDAGEPVKQIAARIGNSYQSVGVSTKRGSGPFVRPIRLPLWLGAGEAGDGVGDFLELRIRLLASQLGGVAHTMLHVVIQQA